MDTPTPGELSESELAASIAGDGDQETHGTWLDAGCWGDCAGSKSAPPAPDVDGDWYESRS